MPTNKLRKLDLSGLNLMNKSLKYINEHILKSKKYSIIDLSRNVIQIEQIKSLRLV